MRSPSIFLPVKDETPSYMRAFKRRKPHKYFLSRLFGILESHGIFNAIPKRFMSVVCMTKAKSSSIRRYLTIAYDIIKK